MKFQVGDIVEDFGLQGKIIEIFNSGDFPIRVKFDEVNQIEKYTIDGKWLTYAKIPQLKLISKSDDELKPSKTKKLTIKAYINIVTGDIIHINIPKKEYFGSNTDYYRCPELDKQYTILEEE